MATLQSNDANILDAETIHWKLIVFPVAALAILILGGLGGYYYVQNQKQQHEDEARAALLQAKTPEALVKVADQFAGTNHATLALLGAAQASFSKQDYAAATSDYQRIISAADTDAQLRDSAQIGLASSLEAGGKLDDAINAYLEVAHRGDKSPYAPYAYFAAARLYDQRGDKDSERKILSEATSLDSDSQFVKQAQEQLKALAPPMTVSVPVPTPTPMPTAPATGTAPTPVKP